MNELNMPKHIAIIMDGNRRWAREKGLDIKQGHKQGAKTLEKIVRYANKIGLQYITVYAFSTENWKRTKEEVGALMLLLQNYLDDYSKRADTENIRVKILGDITALSEGMQKSIKKCMERTKDNTGVTFNIALNSLYTEGQPDPDLVIRTSGEIRTSGFLTWQAVYSEYIFIEKNWPDFTEQDLDDAIEVYKNRNRKFGAQ